MLAVQHHELEQQIETSGAYASPQEMTDSDASLDNSEDEFYDCDVNDSAGKLTVMSALELIMECNSYR